MIFRSCAYWPLNSPSKIRPLIPLIMRGLSICVPPSRVLGGRFDFHPLAVAGKRRKPTDRHSPSQIFKIIRSLFFNNLEGLLTRNPKSLCYLRIVRNNT